MTWGVRPPVRIPPAMRAGAGAPAVERFNSSGAMQRGDVCTLACGSADANSASEGRGMPAGQDPPEGGASPASREG
jgi:hypothetical protein